MNKIVNGFILFFLTMPSNTDAYRVVPESTLRKHFHTLCYKAVMKRDLTAHMARRTTLIGYQVEL